MKVLKFLIFTPARCLNVWRLWLNKRIFFLLLEIEKKIWKKSLLNNHIYFLWKAEISHFVLYSSSLIFICIKNMLLNLWISSERVRVIGGCCAYKKKLKSWENFFFPYNFFFDRYLFVAIIFQFSSLEYRQSSISLMISLTAD